MEINYINNLNKEEKYTFILNLITIGGFILYVIGIYLHVVLLGLDWGNVAVDLSIRILGPFFGLLLVVLIGGFILFFCFFVKKLRIINIFLCWFWIISLYQCAINSFLQYFSLPDEPVNQFFKFISPRFWYPIKEIIFIVISVLLTIIWVNKVHKLEVSKWDWVLIFAISTLLITATLVSQIFLINP